MKKNNDNETGSFKSSQDSFNEEFYAPISQALEHRNRGYISRELESQVIVNDSGDISSMADGFDTRNNEEEITPQSQQPTVDLVNYAEIWDCCFQAARAEFEGLVNSETHIRTVANMLFLDTLIIEFDT